MRVPAFLSASQSVLRLSLFSLLILTIGGCQIVYRLPTRQGNIIEQKQLDQLKLGMTPAQVTYLLGTPLATSQLDSARWDYVSDYRSPRGEHSQRVVSLYFEADQLARMEGVEEETKDIGAPTAKRIIDEQKQAAAEDERHAADSETEAGIVITPPKPIND